MSEKVFATRIQLTITAVTCIGGLALQFAGVVWWASSVNSELKANTSMMMDLKRVVEAEKEKTSPLLPRLDFLSAQILDLKTAMTEFKTDLRDERRERK